MIPRRRLTEEIPGVPLVARASPEDFVVEEVPLFPPSGKGTHTYVTIEKRLVSTAEAVRGIARRLGRQACDIGVAGLKDARAVATQTLSIEHLPESERARIDDPPRVRALSFAASDRKLKMAFLEGNRFRLKLRAPSADGLRAATDEELARASRVVERLSREGLPNWFGEQRFGGRGTTHLLGRALLRGEHAELLALLCGRPAEDERGRLREARERFDAGDLAGALDAFPRSFRAERAALKALRDGADAARAVRAIDRHERRLYLNAAQSAVFNALLEARLDARALGTLETGDVALIHRSNGAFIVKDAAAEAPRAAALDLSPAGPLWGAKLLRAQGPVAAREEAALAAFGLEHRHFEDGEAEKLAPGARRPYRIPVREARISRDDADGGALLLELFLPAGSYATAVIGEIVKDAAPPRPAPAPEAPEAEDAEEAPPEE